MLLVGFCVCSCVFVCLCDCVCAGFVCVVLCALVVGLFASVCVCAVLSCVCEVYGMFSLAGKGEKTCHLTVLCTFHRAWVEALKLRNLHKFLHKPGSGPVGDVRLAVPERG